MTDRPIIFSAATVRALLAGCKTQTRRLAWHVVTGEVPLGAERAIHPTPWQRVRVGDRLWVRETWSLSGHQADATGKEYFDPRGMLAGHLRFRADAHGYDVAVQHWRSAIHMPCWASRLTLSVIAMRIERLQAITDADAMAEGVPADLMDDKGIVRRNFRPVALMNFIRLWESLHGVGAWDINPEIVVISFKVEARNIDQTIAA
jgi:hypothetical protein